MKQIPALTTLTLFILAGCATTDSQKPEKGMDGTIAYLVEVESSEPGARIEVNNDSVGKTPTTIKIFGDKDGTFHHFDSHEFKVTAYPARSGQQPQTKIFTTGGWFTSEDKIPKKMFFDFGAAPESGK